MAACKFLRVVLSFVRDLREEAFREVARLGLGVFGDLGRGERVQEVFLDAQERQVPEHIHEGLGFRLVDAGPILVGAGPAQEADEFFVGKLEHRVVDVGDGSILNPIYEQSHHFSHSIREADGSLSIRGIREFRRFQVNFHGVEGLVRESKKERALYKES